MSNAFIKIKNLILDYTVYDYSVLNLKSAIISLASAGRISSKTGAVKVRSIQNLSLDLQAGDKIALIGGNGAGKTSLLKVMAGIYQPSGGSVKINGSITTILGTGFGLDEEATGYENITLGGIALGYTLKEMQECADEIAQFTELGDFLQMPLRTYSAGMRARLAFGIATCKKPDIILIDEGIGAGDASFFEKANRRLESFLGNASILVIASHSDDLINRFCNKCLYMQNGEVKFYGDLKEGLKKYHADTNTRLTSDI